MNKVVFNKLHFAIATACAFSAAPALSATYAVDARGDAMGGVGVVAATYLTAPFYNPAMAAIYRRNDDAGMILPGVGVMYDDQHQLQDNVDAMADIIKSVDLNNPATITQEKVDQLDKLMNDMQGDSANLELGTVAAFGIPNSFLSATIFGKAYAEAFVAPDIPDENTAIPDDNLRIADRANRSKVRAVSIGILEAGVTLAKYQTVLGQHMSFGISPKIQRINTYVYSASVQNYELKDVFENSSSESVFNIDAGALWFHGPLRVGVSATNLISRDVETGVINTTAGDMSFNYQLRPQYTVGAGLVYDYFSLSADYDLNEDERFDQFADNTQWLRVGMEIDIMRQLYLRAGYKKNYAYDNIDDTITGGIGLSPLGLFELDLAVSYTNEHSKGAYVNFLATY